MIASGRGALAVIAVESPTPFGQRQRVGRRAGEACGWPLTAEGWNPSRLRALRGFAVQSLGGWRLAAGGWRLAAGGWRLAAGGWRLAAGGWNLSRLRVRCGFAVRISLRPLVDCERPWRRVSSPSNPPTPFVQRGLRAAGLWGGAQRRRVAGRWWLKAGISPAFAPFAALRFNLLAAGRETANRTAVGRCG
ncbi:hypothetical protein EBL85_11245 [Marichromatium sp. AB32]|nr:hypothetical protein EBL85_11245 [Marichromatium sp. AB32]